MMSALNYTNIALASSLKQQYTGRYGAPPSNIIPFPSQSVFALTP